MSICISIGHGKTTSGAYDPGYVLNSFYEHELAKKIGLFAYEYLKENFDLECETLNFDSELFLTDRIKKINQKKYDLVVEIHLNLSGGEGVEAYRSVRSNTSLGEVICNEVSRATGMKNGGVKEKTTNSGCDFHSIIRETNSEVVIVTCGFMNSLYDMNVLSTTLGQKEIGSAIAKGIAIYKKLI